LCGYSREGTFDAEDEGDKTVGDLLAGPAADTGVFYERRLMPVLDALQLAAETVGFNNSCGLAGHALMQNEEMGEVEVYVVEDTNVDSDDDDNDDSNPTALKRYFVPAVINNNQEGDDTDSDADTDPSVHNFGQFCNGSAWSFQDPPLDVQHYNKASFANNIVHLAWRLEYEKESNSLVPSWPVSVLTNEVTFTNADVCMELGTRYGWNYCQASVDLDNM
jgi:hypothetical protein